MPVWTHYFAHFVVVVIATISFGITFQMPRRHYLACGLTGAVGWMVYIFCVELFALSPAIATLVATLPLTGCARFFSIRLPLPGRVDDEHRPLHRRGGFHIRPRALLIAAHSHGRI